MKKINNYAGLEYILLTLKKESFSIQDALKIDTEIAKEITKNRPLRGKEIHFLRKQLRLSCAKLSVMIGGTFDASTISKWEKKETSRLAPANEMFMRVFFAEKFNVQLSAKSDELIPEIKNETIEYAA